MKTETFYDDFPDLSFHGPDQVAIKAKTGSDYEALFYFVENRASARFEVVTWQEDPRPNAPKFPPARKPGTTDVNRLSFASKIRTPEGWEKIKEFALIADDDNDRLLLRRFLDLRDRCSLGAVSWQPEAIPHRPLEKRYSRADFRLVDRGAFESIEADNPAAKRTGTGR